MIEVKYGDGDVGVLKHLADMNQFLKALLTCRMQEEADSFENVDEYKAVRGIAWLYNQYDQSEQEAIQRYAQKNGCTEETAAKFLALVKQNRRRGLPIPCGQRRRMGRDFV